MVEARLYVMLEARGLRQIGENLKLEAALCNCLRARGSSHAFSGRPCEARLPPNPMLLTNPLAEKILPRVGFLLGFLAEGGLCN